MSETLKWQFERRFLPLMSQESKWLWAQDMISQVELSKAASSFLFAVSEYLDSYIGNQLSETFVFCVLFFHLCVCAKSLQSCLTLCNSMDCSPPGFSVHGILQARILEWVAMPPPGELPDPRIKLTSPGRRTVFPACPLTGWISPLFPLEPHPQLLPLLAMFPCDFSGSLMPLWLQFQLSFFQLILGQRGEETF